MAVNLNVQADVIDIRTDIPKPDDIFFVDTNVWFWQTYPNASIVNPSSSIKIREYSAYLSTALQREATLTYSGLSLAELAHIIERNEFDIYKQSHPSIKLKEYRHNLSAERTKVVFEVQLAWSQVEAIAVPISLTIDDESTNAALIRFQTQTLDGYDLLLLESISRSGAGQIKIITDDMDYAVVPNIQVFTSNRGLLQAASTQGKLFLR